MSVKFIVRCVFTLLGLVLIGALCIEEKSFIAKWWISLTGFGIVGTIIMVIANVIGGIGIVGAFGGIGFVWWAWGWVAALGGSSFVGFTLSLITNPQNFTFNITGMIVIILCCSFGYYRFITEYQRIKDM